MEDFSGVWQRQGRVASVLVRLRHSPPPVLLLEGGSCDARRLMAAFWTAALLCPAVQGPCGGCPSCMAVVGEGHRDVLWVRGDEGTIAVDQARELRFLLQDPPALGDWRVAVLLEAQTLTAEAANALLKTLEEPSSRARFCLTVPHRDALLPTVVSRAFPLTLAAEPLPPDPELDAWMASLAQFVATGRGDWLGRTGAAVAAPLAQRLIVEVQRAALGVLRGGPCGPLADVLTRRADALTIRQAIRAGERALARLEAGVGPAVVLDALALELWRLCA
jgi:DNA polymerase-3 subunit delta'